jgi:RHS repeat-associated protein
VAQIGHCRYEYDPRGRTVRKVEQADGFRPKEWRYEWDDFDRLRQVKTPEGSLWQYRYDAFGRRVEKRCLNPQSLQGAGRGPHRRTKDRVLGQPHRTRSLWQGSQIVEQWRSFKSTDPDNAREEKEEKEKEVVQIDRWHYELGGQSFKPLAKESLLPLELQSLEAEDENAEHSPPRSHLYPVVSDHLGTPKELYNLKGECVWQAQHELWGRAHIRKAKRYSEQKALRISTPYRYATDEDFELPGIECELRFAGQWEDEESGLHFNFNRYYDPQSGQYLSQDPIGLEGGLRTHGYVADPLTWVDPLGLAGCGENGKAGAFRQAKADAKIPRNQHPDKVFDPRTGKVQQYRYEPMTDKNGGAILGPNGAPIMTKEYTYTRENGSKVIIQNHSAGHYGYKDGIGNQGPHFNVRPIDNTRTGKVPGTREHYRF